ncbi:MAG: hypothetical protein WC446_00945 [Candidatus Paceibacterota bacterium]|jgi:hypothetical protein
MYDKLFREYKEKQQGLLFKMKQLDNADKKYYITANTILSLAQRAHQLFKSSEPEEKRQFINFVFQNLKLDGKNPLFKTKAPFERVLEYQDTHNWGRLRDAFRTLDWDGIKEDTVQTIDLNYILDII